MKNISIVIAILLFSVKAFAQDQVGINFLKDKKWDEALAMAKAENKLIFVDVYTDWCGPCKVMDEDVFPKKNVGTQFNTAFINYKLDAEKGEGPVIAKKYLVKSYPNYLFVNGDGVLIYRSTSSMSPLEFIDVAKNALIEAKQEQTVMQLDALYPTKKKDKNFMFNYLSRRTTLRLDNADLLDEYISMLAETERGEIKNLQLILDNGMFLAKSVQLGIALETLKKHKDKFGQLTQKYKEGIDGIERTAIATTLKKAIAKKDELLLQKVLKLRKPASESPFNNKEITQLEYYFGTNKKEPYLAAAKKYQNDFLMKFSLDTLAKWDLKTVNEERKYLEENKKTKEETEEILKDYRHAITIQLTNAINDIAKRYASLTKNTEDLKIALAWSNYSLKITESDPEYYQNVIPIYQQNNYSILYKSGERKLAIAKMEELVASVNNPKAKAYFLPVLTKMKADEDL